MKSNLSDAQYSLVIQTVAKIPCEPARKPFLVELEKHLPKAGKITDAQLLESINAALKSFKPGQWRGDAQGVFPPITEDLSLKEAATLYERVIHPRGEWCWPPVPMPTPEQTKAKAEKLAAMSQEQRGAAYARTLYETEEDYQAAKAAEEKRRRAEELADATPWPLPSPPTTRTIRGEVVSRDDEPDEPIVPLADRQRAKPVSIYGRHLAWLRGELPADDDESKTEAINERLRQERLLRRRLQGKPKAFF